MAKRKSAAGEDDEGMTVRNKRSKRVEDEVSDAESEEEETANLEEETDEEQRAFDNKFAGRYLDDMSSRTQKTGSEAESGIIKSLEMKQFMCHEYLTFKFGPRVNFIVGHNGSGKSAVLTALTIALGGKAALTGRGNGLKSFIKEGKTWSEVTVVIKNEGQEAYEHDKYGDSIVITRHFTATGSSHYRIKSWDLKTISTKREELAAICDHMNIQVDNPINILTQDSARQFIGASKPKEKYELFLKGTQLRQLSEEYELCRENTSKTEKILGLKKEELPELKRNADAAQAKVKGAQKAITTKDRLQEINEEKAWAYVAGKYAEMAQKYEELEKVKRRVEKAERKVDEAEVEFDKVSRKLVDSEEELAQLGNISHITNQVEDLDKLLKENRDKLRTYKDEIKRMTDEMTRAASLAQARKREIEEEEKKLHQDKQAEQEERRQKIELLRSSIQNAKTRTEGYNGQIASLEENAASLGKALKESELSMTSAQAEMEACKREIDKLAQANADKINTFGRNMAELRRRIAGMRWNGETPVGPLGLYVNLRDPRDRRWAEVMQITLGRLMTSFAVTNAHDRGPLHKLLMESGNAHMQVIVSETDLFDYRSGEPAENVRTMLRELKFSDEYVKRIFINQSAIERTALAETRREAEELSSLVGSRSAYSRDLFKVSSFGSEIGRAEGFSSNPIEQLSHTDPRRGYFMHDSPEQAREHWRSEGRKADEKLKAAQQKADQYQAQLRDMTLQLNILKRDQRAVSDQTFNLNQSLAQLQSHQEDVPVNLAALNQALEEAEKEEENIKQQLQPIMESKEELSQKQIELLRQQNDLRPQVEEFENKKVAIEKTMIELAGDRVTADDQLKKARERVEAEQKVVKFCEAEAKQLEKEYELWEKQAYNYCDGSKFENPRPMADVEREIKSVERALKQQEEQNGASIEELQEEAARHQRIYKEAKELLTNLQVLNKMLKDSLQRRIEKWFDFRSHIALRTKLLFSHSLSNRGYYGKVLFNHADLKLELKVQTNEQAATQGMSKDLKSLSGGEKSFSTICLLLALWEAIGCPIRCLDEFDVFMDAVNRRISMKMMIETANASHGKQYILITPQDLSNIKLKPDLVRLHRMVDPERGQTTL